ncbi:hypothetical protein [Stutzerimonas xanthomarina]|uniref:hypothetical protein n=1 Tax=Stutzerimonas xanthomarina TaxID=271420 RepID=UPI003AA8353C
MSLLMPGGRMTLGMPPLYVRAFEVAARFGSFTQAAQPVHHSERVQPARENTGKTSAANCSSGAARAALTPAAVGTGAQVGFRTLENACIAVNRQRDALPESAVHLTMRWLLGALEDFSSNPQNRVQLQCLDGSGCGGFP